MRKSLKWAAAILLPLFVLGWAAFRPEKLFIDQQVSEAAPIGAQPSTLKGEFVSHAHPTEGKASIVTAAGKRYLRLTGFRTSNGPDVRVVLTPDRNTSSPEPSRLVDLGALKGNVGDQNYELPAAFDAKNGAVAIWCRRFNVSFGGAVFG